MRQRAPSPHRPCRRLFRTTLNFENWYPCLGSGAPWAPPQGLELRAVLNLTEPARGGGGGTAEVPFAVVLLDRAAKQLAVVIRGTANGFEWYLDFAYNQVIFFAPPRKHAHAQARHAACAARAQTAAAVPDFGTPVHSGFDAAYSEIWPGIQQQLDELVVKSGAATEVGPFFLSLPSFFFGGGGGEGCCCAHATSFPSPLRIPPPPFACCTLPPGAQVFVTGHSLGAAVATLVGFSAQGHLDSALGAKAPVVGVVLAAPPNVGPPAFTSAFNTKVNARRLAFQYDIVPQARGCVHAPPA